jgi:hypothetical protein
MKIGDLAVSFLSVVCAIAALPAYADSALYSNVGPGSYGNGTDGAYYINGGYAVTDSFALSQNSLVSGVTFALWLSPGDTLTSVDWAITPDPFGGTPEASGTATVFSNTYITSWFGSYDIDRESIALPNLPLSAGTYWFQLANAVSAGGNSVSWDESDGPSIAQQTWYGNEFQQTSDSSMAGSETFTFTTPEPSFLLQLSVSLGLLALLGVARRRLRVR